MCGLGNPLVFKNEKKVVTFPFTPSGPDAPAGMHCILKREAETGCSCSPLDLANTAPYSFRYRDIFFFIVPRDFLGNQLPCCKQSNLNLAALLSSWAGSTPAACVA